MSKRVSTQGGALSRALKNGFPVPVYRLHQPRDCEAAYCVPPREALRLVEHGIAWPIKRGTAIRLMFGRAPHLRDESAKIGEQTIHAYIAGCRKARAAVDLGWGPQSERMQHLVA